MMEVVGAVSVCCLPSIMCWMCCRCPKAPDLTTPSSPSLGSPPWPRWRVWQTPQPRKAAAAARGSADTVIVKVEVHSSSSGAGSDENMSSSDLSERGSGSGVAAGDHDYEDIYLVRNEAGKTRSNSRDSGSHSLSSNHSNVVVTENTISNSDVTSSNTVENKVQKCQPQQETKSCEEQSQKHKTKLNHSHSMPYHQANSRALKRVVSEPGAALPPPPPPPPPDDLSLTSTPDSSIHTLNKAQRSESQSSHTSSSVSVDTGSAEEPSTLRASSVTPSKSDSPEDAATAAATPAESPSVAPATEAHAGPNLVNKQMVLPFIPPKFPSTDGDEHSLIKPSEYLRALGNKVHPLPLPHSAKVEVLPAVHSQPEDKTGGAVSVVVSAGPPPPPLPEPVVPPARKADQPLGAISIQDLHSVQLRRTSKLTKTMSAPPTSLSGKVEAPFQVAKHDLIEELKKSKDITGIKKMKVEKVKMEEQHEKELVTEITKQLSVESFVEKIPEKDNTGNPIPPWKRQMLAKKAADKARKEMEEELARQAEEKRLQSIPAWKRQLMQSKKPEDKAPSTCTTPTCDDKKMLSSMQIIENGNNKPTKENKENDNPVVTTAHKEPEGEDEPAQIIPWRAQLRKTNSTLNLLE